MQNKKIIFILGMHRNGTSAITRLINLMGAGVPDDLMPANSDNENGYWESKSLVAINNQLLKLAGTSWFASHEIDSEWFKTEQISALKKQAIEWLMAEFSQDSQNPLLIKDPRICRLLPFWHAVLTQMGVAFEQVLIFRQPMATFLSFQARYNNPAYRPAAIIHAPRLNLLWLRYLLEAEYHSRQGTRLLVNYQNLLDYPMQSILTLEHYVHAFSASLGIHPGNKLAIDAFIQKKYQHHKNAQDKYQHELALAQTVFKELSNHSNQTAKLDTDYLDSIRKTLNCVAKQYRPLMTECENNIHADAPWYAEMADTVMRNVCCVNRSMKILFFSAEPNSKGHTYRVSYRMQALQAAAIEVAYQSLDSDIDLALLCQYSAIYVFRSAWNQQLETIYAYCQQHHIMRIFDVDDLVFQPELMTPENWDYLRLQSEAEKQRWQQKFTDYAKTLSHSDYVIVTTKPLAQAVEVFNKPVAIITNGIGRQMLEVSQKILQSGNKKPSEVDGFIRLGYASGTPTHQKDFAQIYPLVCQILTDCADTMLTVVGCLNLDEFPLLHQFQQRIETRPLVPHMDLFLEYYRFDINLSPLQSNNQFCEGKSQLKYHEAALLGVPTIASATQPYCDAIHQGITGFYANNEQQWDESIRQLLLDKELRVNMGKLAQQHVLAKFGPETQSLISAAVISHICQTFDANKETQHRSCTND